MGDPTMKSDTTVQPPHLVTPFLPQSQHPSTTEVDQMINSRMQNAVEQLRSEFSNAYTKNQRNREIAIGVIGGAAGVLVFVGGKWVINRMRAPAGR